MKKTYMIPSQKIAELDMECMIAESNVGFQSLNEQEGYGEQGYEGGYTKEDKSSLWDNLW